MAWSLVARCPGSPRPCFVDLQGAASEFRAVQCLDGCLGLGILHFHKTETTGTAGFPVTDEIDGKYIAVLCKMRRDLILGSGPGEIPDVDGLGLKNSL